MDTNAIKAAIESKYSEARAILTDKDKLNALVSKAKEKLAFLKLEESIEAVPLIIDFVKAYAAKEYTQFPVESAVILVAALIYLIVDKDIIPDNVPVLGHLDDAAVILFALNMVNRDLQDFKAWRDGSAE